METLAYLGKDCLLQHYDLKPAPEIDLSDLKPKTVAQMLHLGRDLTDQDNYQLVAFNQFKPETLASYGLGKKHLNAIYISSKLRGFTGAGCLVVNPSILEESVTKFVQLEACGSIGFGDYGVWMVRPAVMSISGLEISEDCSRELNDWLVYAASGSGCFRHEVDHLLGKTALDRPEDFFDFRGLTKKDWADRGVWHWGRSDPKKVMAGLKPEWLVFDRHVNRFLVVDAAGNFLRNF